MMLEFFGYLGAIIIGIVLGLTGSGGSILAVPILIYLFLLDEKTATGYSLFIVGVTALIGAIQKYTESLVDIKIAIAFGIPSIIGVLIVRNYIVPELPDVLFSIGNFQVSRRLFIMNLFAITMLLAAYSMLRKNNIKPISLPHKYNYLLIFIEGILIGGLTGLIGAGGGFIIVPALVLLGGLEMKIAVGTSLVIVALKSLIGFFVADVFHLTIDWQFLLSFALLSAVGIFIGNYLTNYISDQKLKTGFAYGIILMAIFIFIKEITYAN